MDKRIGAQLFTIRDYMKTIEEFDASCKKIKDMGYKIVQISGTPLEAKPMKEVLDKYDLKCVVTHKPYEQFRDDLDYIIDYNKTLGCDVCGIGGYFWNGNTSKETIEEFLATIKVVCERFKEEGLYFGYHNHAHEFELIDDKPLLDHIIENTDSERATFILDTCWVDFGGADVVEYINKLKNRIKVIHFKDYNGVVEEKGTPNFAEIGNGCLEWDPIFKACEDANVEFAVVEQDICPGNPFDSLKISYDYLINKGFI